MYWNIVLNWNLYESQIELNKHPEWKYRDWLFASSPNITCPNYGLNNPQVQEWSVNAIINQVVRDDPDRVFLDAGSKVPKEQYESLFKMIDEVGARIGEDKIVIFKCFRVDTTALKGGRILLSIHRGYSFNFSCIHLSTQKRKQLFCLTI